MPRKQLAESMILCKGNNTPALKCCGTKRISEFYDSWSPFSDGKVNYCKDCCKSIFEYYLEQTHSIQAALYFTLQKMDVPFIKEIYTQMNKLASDGDINGKKTPITITGYMASLQRKTSMKTIWTDFSATDIDLSEINSKLQNDNVKKSEMEKFILDWGEQDEVKDYQFLEDTFDRYTDGITFANQAQIDKYRDLCLDRLRVRKIQEKRIDKSDNTETLDNIQKRIDREMAMLKLDEFESARPKTSAEQLLFEKIRLIDTNNVTDIYSEPSKGYDLNKIAKYNKDMSLRPLGNMLVGNRDFKINLEDIEKYDL